MTERTQTLELAPVLERAPPQGAACSVRLDGGASGGGRKGRRGASFPLVLPLPLGLDPGAPASCAAWPRAPPHQALSIRAGRYKS